MKLIKKIHIQGNNSDTSAGIYSSNTGKVFVKSVVCKKENSTVKRLEKEFFIFKFLKNVITKNSLQTLAVPSMKSFKKEKKSAALISEYISGKELSEYSPKQKAFAYSQILRDLRSLSKNSDIQDLKVLPKRTRLYILSSFSIWFFIVCVRNIKNAPLYLKYLCMFYFYYLTENIFSSTYGIAHRDIHSKNIIVKDKFFYLLDPEVMAVAEPLTDVAILAKAAPQELKKEYVPFITSQLKTDGERKRFISLSLYYAFQIMALRKKKDPDYIEGSTYLETYLPKILSNIIWQKKTFAQKFLLFVTKFLSLFSQKMTKKNIILCYHSVGNDSWEFTVDPEYFEDQISYVQTNSEIVSLSEIEKQKKSVAITFDDGYENVFHTVVPLVKKYSIKPTMFVLGNSQIADRKELNNQNQLLTIAQIKQLKDLGWNIGYHTKTHADLRKLSYKELQEEIILSKLRLEKKLGFQLRDFAYPRGLYSEKIDYVVSESNFQRAYTVDGGSVTSSQDELHINRICFEGDLELYQFKTLLSDFGISFYSWYMKTLTIKEKISFAVLSFLDKNPTISVSFRSQQ